MQNWNFSNTENILTFPIQLACLNSNQNIMQGINSLSYHSHIISSFFYFIFMWVIRGHDIPLVSKSAFLIFWYRKICTRYPHCCPLIKVPTDFPLFTYITKQLIINNLQRNFSMILSMTVVFTRRGVPVILAEVNVYFSDAKDPCNVVIWKPLFSLSILQWNRCMVEIISALHSIETIKTMVGYLWVLKWLGYVSTKFKCHVSQRTNPSHLEVKPNAMKMVN